MITLRAPDVMDAPAMSRVLIASIRDLCGADHGDDPQIIARWTANKTPESLSRWIEHKETWLLLAERDGDLAGVGGATEAGVVILNYVSPDHRRTGVSRTMLTGLETILRDRGVVEGRLESTLTAHPFYRAMGWRDAGEAISRFGMPGQPMVKRLSR